MYNEYEQNLIFGGAAMLFLAENLKNLRKQKNMTQEEVAGILNISPQSVSKWERGDTFPDITLLPALADLYRTSVDALIGMDRIRDTETKNKLYTTVRKHMCNGDYRAAADLLTEAIKTYPTEEGFLSELAIALALDGEPEKLSQAVALSERILAGHKKENVYHTTRAVLCFLYLKQGEKEKAITAANALPHIRESREAILSEIHKALAPSEIDAYLRFLETGEK